ncbi:Dml1p [Kluyveromyces lactis]|uniref:Protein DML1 n=1 Tax=Kluyveromyces lactis (strain ATCC 8585 / CBS 2359 / DSM 70799 / NBRC 1267 / NRRL Y-1140 / WM37) TaxID=284590 RepID=DML1_KLULA|nr:uncharacterized protein KLLA0_C07381g [Kluyveromyces lactis]Q6CU61.1 RecName: Full=Protein DML1 [Kluyveromyces lactis NRRL Y-1140]CAH01379.1 KLLA0C07381p [Kluyveromyces lactis]|eukprot:XP_452528.1 uncharacterized protein KLLA0_C07381g [Kluyveromyces lactis]
MREIINVSVSHRSNHLITQFYNCLEPLLHDADQENDVFLNPNIDKVSKTVSYTPRALLWDAKLGNGSLGTYQYVSENDYADTLDSEQGATAKTAHRVQTHDRIRKSPYQLALDQGATVLPKINDEIAKYWSDYSKLIYDPSSFNTLQDWYHDAANQQKAPNFQNLRQVYFDNYETGSNQFRENYSNEFFDSNLHQQLEKCDSLQGFNIITELDNGWGGFSSSMLLELKDELPKVSYHTYGWNQDDVCSLKEPVHSTKTKFQMLCNKIRATIALSQESDLFFPLYANTKEAFWRSTGETVLLFDSVNSVFHGSRKQAATNSNMRKMSHLTNALTLGESKRNIVSKLNVDEYNSFSFYDRMPLYKNSKKPSHTFTQCEIDRVNHKESSMFHFTTYPWTNSDTIPDTHHSCAESVIGVTEKPRDVLKTWEDLVSRYFRYDSDREEIKDHLGTLSLEYEHGWYDDDDSDLDL